VRARHVVSLVLAMLALVLFCFGMAGAAFLTLASITLMDLLADATTGKQSNL
jgi:hypothetical protein